ncbi:MAG: four helix bundle protein [Bacteroidota bacterium]
MKKYEGFRDLVVFQLSYKLAMEIFELTKKFPKEELYSLTDQIRRSSRSVPVNIAEGFRKRQYPKMFANKLSDSDGEASETQVWLDLSKDCGYIEESLRNKLVEQYEEVGKMLGRMIQQAEDFKPFQN